MNRISTNLPNDNTRFFMRRQEVERRTIQNQISSQERIQNLRDDPVGASRATRFESYSFRLSRYQKNIEFAQDNHRVTESYMQESVDIMQRVREIAIQGANGTYTQDEMRHMAAEVDELLEELVEIGNAKNGTGNALFAGARSRSEAFQTMRGNVEGIEGRRITEVLYNGDITQNMTEIGDGSSIALNFPGNNFFWAEQQQIYSDVDATDYIAQEDSNFYIDGVRIDISEGDSVFAVIDRINDSDAAVRSRLDPVQEGLVIESTTPHQIWLQDGEGSVLADLGIVDPQAARPPDNIAQGAQSFGGSAYDMVINLRDRLLAGDQIDVGGISLGGIDEALDNMLGRLARLGAQDSRLEIAYERTTRVTGEIDNQLSREVDIDMAQALTDMRMMEYTHQAALGMAGRILPQTLLDFLR